MVVLEAMAAGRPVVVTAATGIAKFVEQAGAGQVVQPGDARALAEALKPFLVDPTCAAVAGERAQDAVRQRVAPDVVAVRREMAYRQAIASRKLRVQAESRRLGRVE